MMSSPNEALTRGGPAVKIDACSVMTVKSASGALRAPWPAEGPRTAVASGMRPDASA